MSPVRVKFPRESTLLGDLIIHQVLQWFSEVKSRQKIEKCIGSVMQVIWEKYFDLWLKYATEILRRNRLKVEKWKRLQNHLLNQC